jgi:arsenite methyltransferase
MSNIHESVQKYYGGIALSGGTESCCSTPQNLYNVELLDGLPVDVTGLSLGCGDPVSIASLQPNETVLDLGSGGGIDCFLAARKAAYVIGVDMTPAMLEKANANKAKLGVQNVEFRQGQIEDLPVDDASVDVIMSNCVINLSPDKVAVFSEMARVLKPGGRVSISDIVIEGEFSPELRQDLDQWSACVTGAIDVADYTDMMREAGFTDITVVDKVGAEDIIAPQNGMPRVYSARITARKR